MKYRNRGLSSSAAWLRKSYWGNLSWGQGSDGERLAWPGRQRFQKAPKGFRSLLIDQRVLGSLCYLAAFENIGLFCATSLKLSRRKPWAFGWRVCRGVDPGAMAPFRLK